MIPAFFVLPTPPGSVPGRGLGNRGATLWHKTDGFLCPFLFRPADPLAVGAGGDLGTSATPTVAQDCVAFCFLLFGGIFRLAPTRQGCGCFGFRFSDDTFLLRPPFQVIRRWFSLTFFLSLTDRPPFFPLFLAFLVGFVVSPFRGVVVGFGEPHLRLMSY